MYVKIMTCVIVLCGVAVGVGFAHPPVDMEVAYDPESKEVAVTIVHPVSDPTEHWIKTVDIAINDKEILEHTISRQDNDQEQVVHYRIPDAVCGDLIGIEGYCSTGGIFKKRIQCTGDKVFESVLVEE